MNSDKILSILNEVADAKPKDKLLLLKKHECPELKRAINAAYNPFIRFGITPQRVSGHGRSEFNEGTWKLLGDLANRRLVGNEARGALDREMDQLTVDSAELLWRIANKDLRAGFGVSTVNKVWPGTIPEFPYMRCSLESKVDLTKWEWEDGVISQIKADGQFTASNLEAGGDVALLTRQGQPLPVDKFPDVVQVIRTFGNRGYQMHGEMVVEKDGVILPRQISNGMINKVCEGGSFEPGHRPVMQVWDIIPFASVKTKGTCETPYAQRLAMLLRAFKDPEASVRVIETRVVKSLSAAYAHFLDALKRGLEGTVIKRKLGIWQDTDGGSKDVVKLKLEADVELKITGYREGETGTKRAKTFGALEAESECGMLKVGVGVGLKDADLDKINADRAGHLKMVFTCRFNDIMRPSESNPLHSLFLPRFIELRTDKTKADDLATIEEVFASAKEGKKRTE